RRQDKGHSVTAGAPHGGRTRPPPHAAAASVERRQPALRHGSVRKRTAHRPVDDSHRSAAGAMSSRGSARLSCSQLGSAARAAIRSGVTSRHPRRRADRAHGGARASLRPADPSRRGTGLPLRIRARPPSAVRERLPRPASAAEEAARPSDRRRMTAAGVTQGTLLEKTSEPAYLMDPGRGRILAANDAGCTMLGYTRAELLETPISHIHPAELAELSELLERVRREQRASTIKLT